MQARQIAEVTGLADAVIERLSVETQRLQVLNDPAQREHLADFINDLPGDISASIFAQLPMLRNAL